MPSTLFWVICACNLVENVLYLARNQTIITEHVSNCAARLCVKWHDHKYGDVGNFPSSLQTKTWNYRFNLVYFCGTASKIFYISNFCFEKPSCLDGNTPLLRHEICLASLSAFDVQCFSLVVWDMSATNILVKQQTFDTRRDVSYYSQWESAVVLITYVHVAWLECGIWRRQAVRSCCGSEW